MHGITQPNERANAANDRSLMSTLIEEARKRRYFLGFVILPALLLATYLYVVSADQYESEAHFVVRSNDRTPSPLPGIGQLLSLTGSLSTSQAEANSVSDYLTSHDAVAALEKKSDLTAIFQRPEADFWSTLRPADPSAERLLKYYRQQVTVQNDAETGITSLRVRTFRPLDSYRLNRELLALGEQRVNELNRRTFTNALSTSRRQLREAEQNLQAIQLSMTRFRQDRRDIDPKASGEAQIKLVSQLSGQLAVAKANLANIGAVISRNSPQYIAVAGQVAAFQAQIDAESAQLSGNDRAIAADISHYEELKLQQNFAGKHYEAAAAAFQKAREQALDQQFFIVRIVEPNLPEKGLYPQRFKILATVFGALMLAYGIGWLIVAGVKEHAA